MNKMTAALSDWLTFYDPWQDETGTIKYSQSDHGPAEYAARVRVLQLAERVVKAARTHAGRQRGFYPMVDGIDYDSSEQ